jgi:hypothetical protein
MVRHPEVEVEVGMLTVVMVLLLVLSEMAFVAAGGVCNYGCISMSKVTDAIFFATPPAIPRWMACPIPANFPADYIFK